MNALRRSIDRWCWWTLTVSTVAHAVIAWHTWYYPAALLRYGEVWSALAAATAVACLAAFTAGPRMVALAGALVCAHATGKGVAYFAQAIWVDDIGSGSRGALYAGGCVYMLVGLYAWMVWSRVLTPWSADRGGK